MPVHRRTSVLRAAAGIVAAGLLAAAAVSAPVAVGSRVTPAADRDPAASAGTGKPAAGLDSDCLTLASPTCYTPLQFRTAYGIQPLTNRGITGKGETVVLPQEEAWRGEPLLSDIRQDLAKFDSRFGLPAPDFRVNTSLAPRPTRQMWRSSRMSRSCTPSPRRPPSG